VNERKELNSGNHVETKVTIAVIARSMEYVGLVH